MPINESFAMNGMSKAKLLLDTNAVIVLIDGGGIAPAMRTALETAEVSVSIITRIELYAKATITLDEIQSVSRFLSAVSVIPLNDSIELETILLRRKYPKRKLPDCIIAATAITLGATLVTKDAHLLNVSFPGFVAVSVSGK